MAKLKLLDILRISLHQVCSRFSEHLIELKTWLDEGQKQLLSESGLVKSLADMVATATPDGKTEAAGCLWSLAYSGLFLFVWTLG